MVIEGLFVNLDLATLQQMRTEWSACLTAIAVAHQSYSVAGRNYTRADLAAVSNVLGEISYAINVNTPGDRGRFTVANMSRSE